MSPEQRDRFARVSEVAELELDGVAGWDFWKEANQKAGLFREDRAGPVSRGWARSPGRSPGGG